MSKMQTYRAAICRLQASWMGRLQTSWMGRLQTSWMGRFGWDHQTPSGKDKDIIITKIRLSNLRLIK